ARLSGGRCGGVGGGASPPTAAGAARPPPDPPATNLQVDAIARGPQVRDGERVCGIIAAGDDLIGYHLSQGFEHRVEAAVGRQQTGANRRGVIWVNQRAPWRRNADRPLEALVEGDVGAGQRRFDGGQRCRHGRGPGAVEVAANLQAAARVVDRDLFASNRDGGLHHERVSIETIVIDGILAAVAAVGDGGQGGSEAALRVVHELTHGGEQGGRAIAGGQLLN